MKMYALIINGCYCGKNSIEKVYSSPYEAVLGAKAWLDEHFSCTDIYLKMLEEFADNDFLSIENILDIDEFEIEIEIGT